MTDPDQEYLIEAWQVDKLALLAKRLYSETRMLGDEMRDNAQMLDAMIERISGEPAIAWYPAYKKKEPGK